MRLQHKTSENHEMKNLYLIAGVFGLFAFAVNLGYRQRAYEANAAGKKRTQKLCRQWAEEKGTYEKTADDGSLFDMPIRWCNSWDEKGVTKGWETNPQTQKGSYIRRWEW